MGHTWKYSETTFGFALKNQTCWFSGSHLGCQGQTQVISLQCKYQHIVLSLQSLKEYTLLFPVLSVTLLRENETNCLIGKFSKDFELWSLVLLSISSEIYRCLNKNEFWSVLLSNIVEIQQTPILARQSFSAFLCISTYNLYIFFQISRIWTGVIIEC